MQDDPAHVTDVGEFIFGEQNVSGRSGPGGEKFFFHHKGKMPRYQMIREELNKALIQSGYGDYSGTHILRHSMSSYSRKEAGLDTAQAMLSHSSARQTEGYAKLDVNEKVTGVILQAEKLFEKSVTRLQPKCNQSLNVVIF